MRRQFFNKGSITKCMVSSRVHSLRVDRMSQKLLVLWISHYVSGSKDVSSLETGIHRENNTMISLFKLILGRRYSIHFIVKHPIIHFIEFDSLWQRSLFEGNKRHRIWKKIWCFLWHCYQIAE